VGCFVTNDRRKRGNWQGFYFLRVSMVGSVGQSVGDLFETKNDMNLLEMVNSFENLWIWFELGCFWNFWLIQFWFQVRFESKIWKMLSKSTKYDWNNTCGWAVRKKKSNKFRFKFNSNQFEKCRKVWMCLKFWLKRVKTCWKNYIWVQNKTPSDRKWFETGQTW
jgi:hypothetical protein